MKIRHNEVEIDQENPFSNCKLGRQKYAEILTDIVRSYPEGFVLAINNEWGTGKTTFVRMWQQLLQNEGFKTVYFNGWENDFDNEPLTAIIAELKGLTDTRTAKVYKSVVEKGAAIAKAVLPSALKTVSKGIVDIEAANTAVENITKATTEAFDMRIKEYLKKKESIKEFRKCLEDFVERTDSAKPIIFIIDELDRCRPNYAVEVLEQMKHFFSVPGIVFVLSIDKGHLAASIRGFYGSEQIDTDEYLRRFIDLEYSIPKPAAEPFCRYLYGYYSFSEFLESAERSKYRELQADPSNFITMSSVLCEKSRLTLRQIEKIFGQTRLILNSFNANHYVLPEVLFLLVFLAALKSELYSELKNGHLTLQEISDEFGNLVSQADTDYLRRFLLFIEATLLVMYGNEFTARAEGVITQNENGELVTSISSKVGIEGKNDLAEALRFVRRDFDKARVKLSHLTKWIDLTEPLSFQ